MIPQQTIHSWYAVRVRPRFERTVSAALSGKGYDEYLPLYRSRRKWSDRAKDLDPSKPEALYQFERALLDDHRIIPLVHLRESYAIAPRVHFQPAASDPFTLHLESAWIKP